MDTFATVVAIGLAAILMMVFPLMTMADRTDDITQLSVQSATVDYTDNIRTTGKITPSEYNKFVETINATGNTYDIEMEVKVLDENPGKKTAQVARDKVGENEYYSIFTSQILDVISPDNGDPATYGLKEGDIISVKVKNVNQTLSQQLKNFFYTVVGNDTYTVAAEHGGLVTATAQ